MDTEERWLLREKYNGNTTDDFYADCERLKKGEPLAYIIGHVPFLSTTIYLDNHPLIPRVETEFWVEKAIAEIAASASKNPRVLDLCAGSGCIGIAVLQTLPHCQVHFAEIDTVLHETIKLNIEKNDCDSTHIKIFGGDLFDQTQGPYDFILSNPPYIANNSPHVASSVLTYEPARALFSGDDGLCSIRNILDEAPTQLSQDGVLYIEHDPDQTSEITSYAQARGLFPTTHNDQYNKARYTRIAMQQ